MRPVIKNVSLTGGAWTKALDISDNVNNIEFYSRNRQVVSWNFDGSGSDYMTTSQNGFYTIDGIQFQNVPLYVKVDTNDTLELLITYNQ